MLTQNLGKRLEVLRVDKIKMAEAKALHKLNACGGRACKWCARWRRQLASLDREELYIKAKLRG